MAQKIAILDYGTGNLHSVVKKIVQFGAQSVVCRTGEELCTCDKLILPGVGHFAAATQRLQSALLLDALHQTVFLKRKPVLGICLGLQLMARSSEEAPGCAGLGWLETEVIRFRHNDNHAFRTPHTGWNTVVPLRQCELLRNAPGEAEFFFTHAYHLNNPTASFISAQTNYGYSFAAAVQQQNLFGVQFHPEKSHAAGETVLKNFLSL